MARQLLFDIANLNPEPPDLQQEVLSPQDLKTAVFQPFAQVPGKINSRVASFRVRPKLGPGKIRVAPIPGWEITTSDRYLADLVVSNVLPVFAEQKGFHVLQRIADRHPIRYQRRTRVDVIQKHDPRFRAAQAIAKNAIRGKMFRAQLYVSFGYGLACQPG